MKPEDAPLPGAIGPLTPEEWCSLRLHPDDDSPDGMDDPFTCCAETSGVRDSVLHFLRMGGDDPKAAGRLRLALENFNHTHEGWTDDQRIRRLYAFLGGDPDNWGWDPLEWTKHEEGFAEFNLRLKADRDALFDKLIAKQTTLAKRAEWFARKIHDAQVDKQGRHYPTAHLKPVAEAARVMAEALGFDDEQTELAVALAWVHDAGEDCFDTDEEFEAALIAVGLEDCCEGAVMLTRRGNRPYQPYVENIAATASIEVVVVKWCDNFRNSTTLDGVPNAEDRERMSGKYRRARGVLMRRIAEWVV